MSYALAVLTSRGREELLAATIRSFEERVRPKPVEALIVMDGVDSHNALTPFLYDSLPWSTLATGSALSGFCNATGELWKLARYSKQPYVFWLEDDFVFNRSVDLRDLMHVMDVEPQVAQMSLLRQPWSDEEVRAGGFMGLNPEAYSVRGAASSVSWFEHSHHWTTNPSLIRKRVIDKVAWPQRELACEGKFRFALHAAFPDASFGIWGAGDPWVTHVGDVRAGHGY